MKRTPLHAAQAALGARFIAFGDWELPVQYSGILEEHRAVRTRAGLFDVSHMGEIELSGRHAVEACQHLTVNDVERLVDGRAQYSLLCHPTGGVVDDIIVHRISDHKILICVNAANTDKDFAWIREHRGAAEVRNRSAEFAQLALQGPLATTILTPLTPAALADLPAFAFCETTVCGHTALVAHTGYTGEDGWELYCRPADAPHLWEAILAAGASHGIVPAGLGARDTLRLERALPLYGHELTDETTPLEAGLGWVVRFGKASFIGHEALRRQQQDGVSRRLVGLTLTEPGIPRAGYPILGDGKVIGTVTSGTKSPTLGKAIALGYVATGWAGIGTRLAIDIRGRAVAATVVPLPFYRR